MQVRLYCPVNRGARRHADGVITDGQVEAHAFFGESVDVRRADSVVAVTADVEGAQLVA
jgi:hypothetical protein